MLKPENQILMILSEIEPKLSKMEILAGKLNIARDIHLDEIEICHLVENTILPPKMVDGIF